MKSTLALAALVSLVSFPAAAAAADLDDNVEWAGISHLPQSDYRPRAPLGDTAFDVLVRAYKNDLSAVAVRLDDGTEYAGSVDDSDGTHDTWRVTVPSPASATLNYSLALTDGADTDYLTTAGMVDAVPAADFFGMDFSTLSHAPIGASPVPGGGTVFKVWAPTRTTVNVPGEFNGWSAAADPLTKVGEHFIGYVASADVGDQYKYVFNGTKWNTDARGRALNAGDNDNAYIVDPDAFMWVNPVDSPDIDKLLLYQAHMGTFSGLNDPVGTPPFPAGYSDMAARVAHLAELGVTGVMLNPITEFPGDRSAGYNPTSQWAAEWIYGTPDELRALVDACHALDIGVYLDIVWNHFSFDSNWMWFYDGTQIYFDDPAVETPWGAQADFDNENVRSYFLDSISLWFDEYKMDGFRVDGTDFMNMGEHGASGWSLMQAMNDLVDRRWPDKTIIAEQLPDDDWVTRATSAGGAGFDSQYLDAFTDRLREAIFDAAFGDPNVSLVADAIDGYGPDLSGRKTTNYLELHDEAWPTSGGQRIVKTIDPISPHDDQWARGRSMLGQGLVFTAPGIPAMLMGTEWLESFDFGTDPQNRIDWNKKNLYPEVFDYYRELMLLRRNLDQLGADAGVDVFHVNESGNVVAFRRWDGVGGHVVVVANFGNTDYSAYRIGLPVQDGWSEALNSQDPIYGGVGTANPTLTVDVDPQHGQPFSSEIVLSKMALVVLRTPSDVIDVGDADAPSVAALRVGAAVPNPSTGRVSLGVRGVGDKPATARVFDAAGRFVADADVAGFGDARLVTWDGRTADGARAASGVYFVRVETPDAAVMRRVVRSE